jgi:hypothetical protein
MATLGLESLYPRICATTVNDIALSKEEEQLRDETRTTLLNAIKAAAEQSVKNADSHNVVAGEDLHHLQHRQNRSPPGASDGRRGTPRHRRRDRRRIRHRAQTHRRPHPPLHLRPRNLICEAGRKAGRVLHRQSLPTGETTRWKPSSPTPASAAHSTLPTPMLSTPAGGKRRAQPHPRLSFRRNPRCRSRARVGDRVGLGHLYRRGSLVRPPATNPERYAETRCRGSVVLGAWSPHT